MIMWERQLCIITLFLELSALVVTALSEPTTSTPRGLSVIIPLDKGKSLTKIWPISLVQVSYNLINNAESWGYQDPGRKNADCFAVKMRVGEDNRLVNCCSLDNIDDGFDRFNKIEGNQNNSIVIENNMSVNNGIDGFSDNFNSVAPVIEDHLALYNRHFNFLFHPSLYTTADKKGTFSGNASDTNIFIT